MLNLISIKLIDITDQTSQFIWNNTVLEVTTDSLFGITWSYSPRMGVEPVETVAPAATDFAAIFNKVIESSEKAKCNMKLQADKHRNPAPDYVVGQQVWLSMDNLQMLNCTSKKLTEKWVGPYEVTHVTLNAVEVKLPKTLWIHLVSWSSRALPGTYLPSLLHQSPSFSVSAFSLSVLRQGCTLVILGLLSRLKSHLWSSLCPLSPQPMSLPPRYLPCSSSSVTASSSIMTDISLLRVLLGRRTLSCFFPEESSSREPMVVLQRH